MSRLEEFLKGYRLSYDNFLWGANLKPEQCTYEEMERRWAIQEPLLADLNGWSRLGGYACLALHVPLALRMHKATQIGLRNESDEQFARRMERMRHRKQNV